MKELSRIHEKPRAKIEGNKKKYETSSPTTVFEGGGSLEFF